MSTGEFPYDSAADEPLEIGASECFFDGYITAIAVTPGHVPVEIWMEPLVSGDEGPPPPSPEDFALMLEMVRGTLRDTPEDYYPLYYDAIEDAASLGKAWAAGFMAGMTCSNESWMQRLKSESYWELVEPIAALAMDSEEFNTLVKPPHAEPLPLTPDDIEEILDLIPESVIGLYEERVREVAMPAHGAKAGRNDPCPCGSGKKYKKCCGA